MFVGQKIITSQEMRRIEKLAHTQGHNESQFMDNAGKKIADLCEMFIKKNNLGKIVYILAGKGNNGGDAYTAGVHLLVRHFLVVTFQLFPKEMCSPLCQNRLENFQKNGGRIIRLDKQETLSFPEKGVILDGLLGTGFHGKVEGILADVIDAANKTNYPILALDIPSGLNGNTGEAGLATIKATQTFYLGFPKIGFFLQKGLEYTGSLVEIPFGLPDIFAKQLQPEAYLIDEKKIELPPLHLTQHKYERGYIVGIAGSRHMEGAAALASLGALRGGAGIVRLFYNKKINAAKMPLEVISEHYNKKRIVEECARASSLFLGPGLGRDRGTDRLLNYLLPQLLQPVVIDADALSFLAENPAIKLPFYSVLTPHRKEMERLLEAKELTLMSCQNFADHKNITLVLKGMPSIVFHPYTKPIFIPKGDPGMATAGSGDILAGIIAALLAKKMGPLKAALTGVYLHALAGEYAAQEKTSYCLIASDILEHLPQAFANTRR